MLMPVGGARTLLEARSPWRPRGPGTQEVQRRIDPEAPWSVESRDPNPTPSDAGLSQGIPQTPLGQGLEGPGPGPVPRN
jgi:hypothetical protein